MVFLYLFSEMLVPKRIARCSDWKELQSGLYRGKDSRSPIIHLWQQHINVTDAFELSLIAWFRYGQYWLTQSCSAVTYLMPQTSSKICNVMKQYFCYHQIHQAEKNRTVPKDSTSLTVFQSQQENGKVRKEKQTSYECQTNLAISSAHPHLHRPSNVLWKAPCLDRV